MVKRKAAPQRLGGESRSNLSWDLASTSVERSQEVITVPDNDDVDILLLKQQHPRKKVRKRSSQDDTPDPFLKEILSYCEFYVTVRRNLQIPKDGLVFHLGNITLQVENRLLPTHNVFWLYVSELSGCSFLYYDAKDTVDYHLIRGSLDVDLFTGLSSRCFGLQFEDPDDDADCVSIRVLLFETFFKSPATPKEVKLRSIVLSHFGSLCLPDLHDVFPAEDKHDIDDLYYAVKMFHKNTDTKCSVEVQHPNLKPQLRPFQRSAVQWMLQRETVSTREELLDSLFVEISTQCGQIFYYNKYSGCIVLEKPLAVPLPTGGILADEMGLGKTVEVLALILANPRNIPDQKLSAGTSRTLVSDETQSCSSKSEPKNLVNREEVVEDSDNVPKNSIVPMIEESENLPKRTPKSRKSAKVVKCSERSKSKKQAQDNVSKTIDSVIVMYCYNGSKAEARKASLKAKKKSSPLFKMMNEWYQVMLSETFIKSPRTLHLSSELECVCGEEGKGLSRVQCSVCRHWQHSQCVGNPNEGTYFCPRCWHTEEPVVSGATLIVSPSSISGQWLSEIQQHMRDDFSVLIYRGVQKDGFLQPYKLASYQLVLTTYETLRKELVHAELNDSTSPRLRHSKRFFAVPSPLPFVQWWRVCLDEAQMVEHTSTKTAEMARRLQSVHRWAITGTPIQKSIQDLFGLMQFLGVEPYNVQRFWTYVLYGPFCLGDREPLLNLMNQILWRTMKHDVLDQINIPLQSQQIHWLNFSPVEEHFYRLQHMLCSEDFVFFCTKFGGLDIPLRSLDRNNINKMLTPLLRLRQACTHHQVVRGFHISQKATMTMDELLESLIKKTKLESEEALRQIIAALNGLAGIEIIRENWAKAVELYRKVLRLAEEHKGSLKVDALQLIHTMHNLSDILSVRREGISDALKDMLYEQDMELERQYMRKCDSQVASAQVTLSGLTRAVCHQEEKFQVGRNEWWAELLDWITVHDDKEELLSRIHLEFETNKLPRRPTLADRMKNISSMKKELGSWSRSLYSAREAALTTLRSLEVLPPLEIVNEAVDCHLRTNVSKKENKCRLCVCESLLKKYESQLFDVSSKQTEHHLVGDVLMLGQLNKGTWKACEHERAIKVLVAFLRGKHADRKCMEDAATYLKWLEALKKEFKQLRHTWTQLRDQVSVRDELHMAKLRLRVRFPDEPRVQLSRKRNPLKQLSSNLDNKVETIHIIEQHEVDTHEARINLDRMRAQDELRRKTGQLQYLKNLGKNQGCKSNPDPCPICRTELGDKWSVLQCGHCFCVECIRLLMQSSGGLRTTNVKCPICRDVTHSGDLSFVDISTKNPDQGLWSNISVKGSHSTKVEAVVRCLLALHNSDPNAKALVFSTWEKVLDVLEKALDQNSISFRRLRPGPKYKHNLEEFKEEQNDAMALLMPVHWGAKGLNLIEATHVLLVEPILNPADELQAIGRVHRIGQTKKTVVHRFLVRGTIEERIHEAVQSSKEDWSEDCLTTGQLRGLFNGFTEDLGLNSDRNVIGQLNNVVTENSALARVLNLGSGGSMPDSSARARSGDSMPDFSATVRSGACMPDSSARARSGGSMPDSNAIAKSGGSMPDSSSRAIEPANLTPQRDRSLLIAESLNNFSECLKNLNVQRESGCGSEQSLPDSIPRTLNTSGSSITASNLFEQNVGLISSEVIPSRNCEVTSVLPCSNSNDLLSESGDCLNNSALSLDSQEASSVGISMPEAVSKTSDQDILSKRFPIVEDSVGMSAQSMLSKNCFSGNVPEPSSNNNMFLTSECELPSDAIPVGSNIEVSLDYSRSNSPAKLEVPLVESSQSYPEPVLRSAQNETLTIGSFVEIQGENSCSSLESSPITAEPEIVASTTVLEEALPSGKFLKIPASVILNMSQEANPVRGFVEIPAEEDFNSDSSSSSPSSRLSNSVPAGDYIEIPASVLLDVSGKNTPVAGYIEVPDGEDSALPVGLSVDMPDQTDIPIEEFSSTSIGGTLSSTLSDEGVSTGEDSNSTQLKQCASSPLKNSSTTSNVSGVNLVSFRAEIGESGGITSTNKFLSSIKPDLPVNGNLLPDEVTLSVILSPPYTPISGGTSCNTTP